MFQENSIETCILSRVKQITGPGWMHETSARTWYDKIHYKKKKKEYWSGWPFPFPENLPDLGIEPKSPAWQAGYLPLSHLGSPQ